jgi:shikimate dehydrogenase
MSSAIGVHTIADLRAWPETNTPTRLAVLGDPVAHSASPPMHNAALTALGIAAEYVRLHIRPEELAETFSLLPRRGFIGVNCTIPHKPQALQLVQQVDDTARRAGGVNTVVVGSDGKLTGHSTDGAGFSRAVKECFALSLRDVSVAVLGAGGGAGRAIAMQCAFEGTSRLVLVNRTLDKIGPLAEEIAIEYPGTKVATASFDSTKALAGCDLVVNCTSLGMKAGDPSPVPAEHLASGQVLYDTIYTASRTPLMLAGDEIGARSANGLPMLLHQGVLSFEIWFHREPPVEAMRAELTLLEI